MDRIFRYPADIRSVAFVVTYLLLVPFSLAIPLGWPTALPLVVVLSFLAFFCAVISHNAIHTPVFHQRWLNRVFQVALSLTYGHPVSMFVPGHNLSHHKYLQTPKDRMRTDKMRFRWNLLNQLLFNFYVGGAIFRDNAEWARKMRTRRPAWFHQFLLEMVFYVLFLVATYMYGGALKFLLFVIVPHQYAVWGIAGINFVQHDGCDPKHPYNHSRNFTSTLVNWFTFNNGYHGIHHLHPALHWSQLPEAHRQEFAPHVDPRLDQPSLLLYCFRAYIWPGKRVMYDGTPVVLGPPRRDEAWIPATFDGTSDAEGSVTEYGAVG